MKQRKNVVKIIFLGLGCGVLIGGVNGFFGGGGGMICVPILLLMGLKNKKAHATAILVMLPISMASAAIYYSFGSINLAQTLWTMLGTVCGATLGAFLLTKTPNRWLAYIFPFVMIAAGVKLIV